MNGYQRIAAALGGDWPDVRPVMLHNFMMAAREAGFTMRQYRSDPEVMARCHIQAVETYGYDGILVDMDTATLAGAAGVPVEFPEDEPALCRGQRVTSLDEARALPPVSVAQYPSVQVWLEAVRLLRRHFGDEVYVRGNCDQCAFSLASMVLGSESWMIGIMDESSSRDAHRLLQWCAGLTDEFIRLMADSGAHMVSNGDSPAGPSLVSPRLYRQFALPYEKKTVEEAHRLGLPYMLHICGKTEPILDDMVSTGADALELDYKTDPVRACDALADRVTFVGNIDPTGVLAQGTQADVTRGTRELLRVFAGTPRFILNAGCAIPADTPPENLRALIRAAREG